jgi:hypothetical protein
MQELAQKQAVAHGQLAMCLLQSGRVQRLGNKRTQQETGELLHRSSCCKLWLRRVEMMPEAMCTSDPAAGTQQTVGAPPHIQRTRLQLM